MIINRVQQALSLLGILTSALYFIGCEKPEEIIPEPVVNRCDTLTKPKIGFEVYLWQKLRSGESIYLPDDTAMVLNNAYIIEAYKVPGAEYLWEIDGQTVTERRFIYSGTADESRIGTKISIELTVTYPTDTCFPNDSGVQKVTRQISMVGNPCESPINGFFRGVWESNPLDTFTIGIESRYPYEGYDFCDECTITNFNNKGCIQERLLRTFATGYNFFRIKETANNCDAPQGLASLKGDSIYFDYTTTSFPDENSHTPNPTEQHFFRGVRVEKLN